MFLMIADFSSPESFRSNSGCVCPWMLTGSRGSCSRGDSCRSYLTAHSFMPFSICIFESKLCSSEDEKYLQQNCALLQRSHTQETVWPQQTVPHLQYFPSHNPRWKASMSFLLVGEVPISTQQRYLISKRCATLKAHRHFQPFFISFQQACSSYFHYKLCNYSNLVEGLSILFMLKPLSHMHSRTFTHTCTRILWEGKGVWKSHFLLTLGDLLTRLLLPGCTINTTKCQPVAVSSSS